MYKINLYPEHAERRRVARRRTARMAITIILLGIEIVLVGVLVASVALLDERSHTLAASLDRLTEQAAATDQGQPDLAPVWEVIAQRRRRIDWAPKLAALSEGIDRQLQLESLLGRAASKGQPAQLELTGSVLGGDEAMEAVSGFIDFLRADQRVAGDFPQVRLGTLRGETGSRFQVICEPKGEGSR